MYIMVLNLKRGKIKKLCDYLLELKYQDEFIKYNNAKYSYKKEMERIKKEKSEVSELPQEPEPARKARLTTIIPMTLLL